MTNDGTVQWIIDDVRDGTPVGGIIWSMCDRAGYIRLDGTKFTQDQYPRLWKWVTTNTLNTGNGLFTYNDSDKSLTTPNIIGRFIEASNSAGALIEAGLPNITATGLSELCYFKPSPPPVNQTVINGFKKYVSYGDNNAIQIMQYTGTNGGWYNSRADFDASLSSPIYGKSTTVQPPAVQYLPLIRY